MKSVRIRSYSGPYFPALGLNKERYRVSFRYGYFSVQMWEKMDQITPKTGTFYVRDCSEHWHFHFLSLAIVKREVQSANSFALVYNNLRSSRPEVICKKGVLRNFAEFIGKHLCQSLFFNKIAG